MDRSGTQDNMFTYGWSQLTPILGSLTSLVCLYSVLRYIHHSQLRESSKAWFIGQMEDSNTPCGRHVLVLLGLLLHRMSCSPCAPLHQSWWNYTSMSPINVSLRTPSSHLWRGLP